MCSPGSSDISMEMAATNLGEHKVRPYRINAVPSGGQAPAEPVPETSLRTRHQLRQRSYRGGCPSFAKINPVDAGMGISLAVCSVL